MADGDSTRQLSGGRPPRPPAHLKNDPSADGQQGSALRGGREARSGPTAKVQIVSRWIVLLSGADPDARARARRAAPGALSTVMGLACDRGAWARLTACTTVVLSVPVPASRSAWPPAHRAWAAPSTAPPPSTPNHCDQCRNGWRQT